MSLFADQQKLIGDLKSYVTTLEKELKEIKSKVMVDVETQYETISLIDELNLYKARNKNNDLSLADMIRETSENNLSDSGYSYDEKTGLYYHNPSGYYYDPINFLFYNPINSCYYFYDSDTHEYKFHSQENIKELSRKEQELLWTQGYQHKPPKEAFDESSRDQETRNKLAPCMRLINDSTGHLAIITCSGGSIGSNEARNHTICVNELTEIEICLQIIYDSNQSHYCISRNSTDTADGYSMINDSIITKKPQTISHHSRLIVNKISFLIHVHEDFGTCNWCEPGQVKEKLFGIESNNNSTAFNKRNKQIVVNQLKIKYGLKSSGNVTKGFWRVPKNNTKSNYVDRALIRRTKEKEDQLKVREPANAALKMMSNMGWNPGESLGKTGTGITEPIEAYQRQNARAGIGCEKSLVVPTATDLKTARKIRLIDAIQKRYKELCKH